MRKFILMLALLMILACSKDLLADENGIVTVEGRNTKQVNFFNSKAITGTSSYIYDDSGNTGDTYGWIDVSKLNVGKTITLYVPVWNSGTITARVESQTGSSTVFGEVVTKSFGAAQTIGYVIPIIETVNKIRVGWKVTSDTGSATVSTSGYFEGN